jgi:hypothetical protein
MFAILDRMANSTLSTSSAEYYRLQTASQGGLCGRNSLILLINGVFWHYMYLPELGLQSQSACELRPLERIYSWASAPSESFALVHSEVG